MAAIATGEGLKQVGDKADNPLRDTWYLSPFRVLADHPEFPGKHWLQIDPAARKQKISQLPPWSTFHIPNNPPKYAGPEPAKFRPAGSRATDMAGH